MLLVAVAATGWGAVGYLATKPTDFHDYRVTSVQSAQSAYNALATARLTGRAKLDGRMYGSYVHSMLDDSRSALSGAAQEFAAEAPPDDATAAMRDRLGPLLIAANAGLAEVEESADAGDEPALRRAVQALDPVIDGLSAFLEEHR